MKEPTVPLQTEFLFYLHQQGFKIGIEHHVCFETLLTRVREQGTPEDLRTLFCPVVAKSADEQKQFYTAFDTFWERLTPSTIATDVDLGSSEKVSISQTPTEEPPEAKKTESHIYVVVWLIVLFLLGAFALFAVDAAVNTSSVENYIKAVPSPVPISVTPTEEVPVSDKLAPTPLPVILDIEPTSGPTNTQNTVKISGQYFSGQLAVLFGEKPGTVNSVINEESITVTTPSHPVAESVSVIVIADGGSSEPFQSFTYFAPPVPSLLKRRALDED